MLSSRMWADWGGGSKKQGLVSMIGRPPFAFSYIYARTQPSEQEPSAPTGWELFFNKYFNRNTNTLGDPQIPANPVPYFPSLDAVIPATIGGVAVKHIADNAFQAPGCPLHSVTIPNSVLSIGLGAVWQALALTTLDLGTGVREIGYGAFYYCTSLTAVTIPDSVILIEAQAFFYCSVLASLTIGNSVTKIGTLAFQGCSLTSLTIPASVTNIGNVAFLGNTSLVSITFAGACPGTLGLNIFGALPPAARVYVQDKVAFDTALAANDPPIEDWPETVQSKRTPS